MFLSLSLYATGGQFGTDGAGIYRLLLSLSLLYTLLYSTHNTTQNIATPFFCCTSLPFSSLWLHQQHKTLRFLWTLSAVSLHHQRDQLYKYTNNIGITTLYIIYIGYILTIYYIGSKYTGRFSISDDAISFKSSSSSYPISDIEKGERLNRLSLSLKYYI